MSAKPPAAPPVPDIIWLCRRLASALQVDQPILSALDSVAEDAPSALARPLQTMRASVRSGRRISDALVQLHWPSFVWGMVRNGENRGDPAPALALIADRLEAEQAASPPKNRGLHAYALGFGRLGVMLGVGLPILTALETAAAAAPRSQAHDVLMAARTAVRGGAELSDALEPLAADLPDMTLDMIRDAEREGRLAQALPIVADYLLDEAAQTPHRARKQEV
ncbi:MAG: type II secretion system F family protein [Armatimonadota bacterium]|nr:MAG: type II secretion system F family protein [Armatimonadota bacterium]